jgi:DNA-directed RNA polymerase specialized sigma24 family protein
MKARKSSNKPPQCDFRNDAPWEKLYLILPPLVKRWVSGYNVSSWKGQEADIVEDIVQEAVIRVYKYAQRAERGEVAPIDSIEHIGITIAQNYCRDLRRKDQRLTRVSEDERTFGRQVVLSDTRDPTEEVDEDLFQESIFDRLAPEILNFPEKQSRALLSDLAKYSHFDEPISPIQKALLRYGVSLQDYRRSRPLSAVERSRHASLLTLAYHRVASLSSMKAYVA